MNRKDLNKAAQDLQLASQLIENVFEKMKNDHEWRERISKERRSQVLSLLGQIQDDTAFMSRQRRD